MSVRELIRDLRTSELDSLHSEVSLGRKRHILKTLDERGRASELVRQQYSGRYAFELLQNANDAIASTPSSAGAARFVLTEQALLVADQGSGFGADEVRAICGLGRSSKDPRKSIGYKGLGFKSVGEITDRPQVISQQVRFGFDELRARRAVQEVVGELDPQQRVPVYAFPFELNPEDLGSDVEVVESLVSDGFTSILRLPIRHDMSRETVARQVQESVTPRLLLFLDATTRLTLSDGEVDFEAEIFRESKNDHSEVLLDADGNTEHWLVYPQLLSVTDPTLVEPLGDAWASVEQVRLAAAVRLDDTGRPAGDRNEPLHVYFPTQEATGLPVVLHADFALDLDRRRISQAPEAKAYNQWLANELAGFVGRVVAPDLATRDVGDGLSLIALAPVGSAVGFGEIIREECLAKLATAQFVRAADGSVRHPAEVRLLPASIPDAAEAVRFLDVGDLGGLVPPQAQNHRAIRALLGKRLQVVELGLEETLDRLTAPAPEEHREFFTFLVGWADTADHRKFVDTLRQVPCVQTAAGDWAPPSSGLFFPRRDEMTFPNALHVPVIAVPEVDGLRELLRDAGVRDFEWRDLLTGFVLPLLTDEHTDPARREAAITALRTYYTTALREEGAQAVRDQAAGVLLPSCRADGSGHTRRPARELYFPSAWTGSGRLEVIYGPFGQADFLAIEPPESEGERDEEAAFLRWLGVQDKPRLLVAEAATSKEYLVQNLDRHPHARMTPHWRAWLQRDDVRRAMECKHGHTYSQQLRRSASLDRLAGIIDSEDRRRLSALWLELAASWSHYEPALTATFRCVHSQHVSDRDRHVPSLVGHQLESAAWVPARYSGRPVLEVPHRVWRTTRDTPNKVLGHIPRIEPILDILDSVPIANRLGVIDAARPLATHLVQVLESLAGGTDSPQGPDGSTRAAARWAMRTLDDVLHEPDAPAKISCPLLARHRGEAVFDRAPYVADDPLLDETFEPLVVILDADRNLRDLHRACDLRHLREEVTSRPLITAASGDANPRRVRRKLEAALPYLAAVAVDAQPSRAEDIYRTLSRLELVICDELTIIYEMDHHETQRPDAVVFIAERIEQVSSTRRRIGTVYLELDSATGLPHWFSLGPQLAAFLNIPGQGDAFGLLLAASRQDREHYLAARRVPFDDVELARTQLDTPPPDEPAYDELINAATDMHGEWYGPVGNEETDAEAADRPDAGETVNEAATDAAGEEPPPLPPLDHDQIGLVDAESGDTVSEQRKSHHLPSAGGLGPATTTDPGTRDLMRRTIGQRAEEAAFAAEQRRVKGIGLHPDAVQWVARDHPYAAYDIVSVDERGNRIFIEVKATADSDPSVPFYISENELTWALAKRDAAYIYRVTEAHTAAPSITRYRDPVGLLLNKQAQLNLGQARMSFYAGAKSDT